MTNDKQLRFFTKVNLKYSDNMAIVIFWLFFYNLNSTYGNWKILRNGVLRMRLRKQALGSRNLIGTKVEEARKKRGMKQKELLAQLQVRGVDMNASGLSKLEGQIRYVTDIELVALSEILEVPVDYLLGLENRR